MGDSLAAMQNIKLASHSMTNPFLLYDQDKVLESRLESSMISSVVRLCQRRHTRCAVQFCVSCFLSPFVALEGHGSAWSKYSSFNHIERLLPELSIGKTSSMWFHVV